MISEVVSNASRFFGSKFDASKSKFIDSMKSHPVKTSLGVVGGAGIAAIALPVAGSLTGFTASTYAIAHGLSFLPAVANIAWAGPTTAAVTVGAAVFGGKHVERTLGNSAENSIVGGVVNTLISDGLREHTARKEARKNNVKRPQKSVVGKFFDDTRNAVLGSDNIINRGINKVEKALSPYNGITGKCMLGGLTLGTLFGGPLTGAGVAAGIGLSSALIINKMKHETSVSHTDVSSEPTPATVVEPAPSTVSEPSEHTSAEPVVGVETEPVTSVETEPIIDVETESVMDPDVEPVMVTETGPVMDTDTEPVIGTETEPVMDVPENDTLIEEPSVAGPVVVGDDDGILVSQNPPMATNIGDLEVLPGSVHMASPEDIPEDVLDAMYDSYVADDTSYDGYYDNIEF